MAYSKNEFLRTVAYKLVDPQEMLDYFAVPTNPECRQNSFDPTTNCPRIVNYFRCNSFSSYLQSHSIDQSLLYTITHLTNFESYLEQALLFTNKIDQELLTQFVQTLDQQITKLTMQSSISETDKFILQAIRWRVFSLSEQLGIMLYILENQQLLDLSLRIHRYLKTLE
jgi:hypothetical protein